LYLNLAYYSKYAKNKAHINKKSTPKGVLSYIKKIID